MTMNMAILRSIWSIYPWRDRRNTWSAPASTPAPTPTPAPAPTSASIPASISASAPASVSGGKYINRSDSVRKEEGGRTDVDVISLQRAYTGREKDGVKMNFSFRFRFRFSFSLDLDLDLSSCGGVGLVS